MTTHSYNKTVNCDSIIDLVVNRKVNGRNLLRMCILLMCYFVVNYGYAQNINPLDSVRRQFELDAAQIRADFEVYEAQARADYFRYTDSIKSIWGGDTIIDNTPKIWVEYAKDFQSRSIVDFENGSVSVETAIDAVEIDDTTFINARLTEAVENLLNSRGSTCPYSSSVDPSLPLTKNPIMDGLIDWVQLGISEFDIYSETGAKNVRPVPPAPTVKGTELALTNEKRKIKVPSEEEGEAKERKTLAEKRQEGRAKAKQKTEQLKGYAEKPKLANKIVQSARKTYLSIKGKDGISRQSVKIQMALVSDNISKNAALYKDLVAEFSDRFQIEQPLIFAIIEQESAFNPQAKSWVPAYGLMQLVPRSGGRDAYRYVYKVDRIPEMSYLYNPRNNIELGTAYLRVLMNQFAEVRDPHCRRLCVIASYNTGPGNVSRSFIGNSNLTKAFTAINRHDYNGLYNHLVSNLPYEETRNYVEKVTKRREKYMKQ